MTRHYKQLADEAISVLILFVPMIILNSDCVCKHVDGIQTHTLILKLMDLILFHSFIRTHIIE